MGNSRAFRYASAFASLALLSGVSIAQPRPQIGFQGYILGQTIEESKAIPLPKSNYGERSLRCTNDSDRPSHLSQTQADAAIGVTRCWPTEIIGSGRVRSGLPVGPEANATTELWFRGDHLYMIETIYDEFHSLELRDALVLKYGRPASETTSDIQNGFGAHFPQSMIVWRVGASGIRMITPDLNIRRMSVTYYDSKAADEADNDLRTAMASGLKL